MSKKRERLPLGELERNILKSLSNVTFTPGRGDKKFYRSIENETWLTEAQRNYLFGIFDRYRRQIPTYQELAIQLEPERFKVKITFEKTLFDIHPTARVEIKDTYTPKDCWTKKDRQRNTLI